MGFFGGGASVDLASPPAIGNTTPNTGAFTFLKTTGGQGATNGLSFTGSGGDSGKIVYVGYGAQVFFGENTTSGAQCMLGNQIRVRIDGQFSWSNSNSNADTTGDLLLRRDAAGVLAQYNSTNAQTFRLYNTFTDASNYERVDLRWTSNTFEINTRNGAAGTGTARNVHIVIPNNGTFLVNGGVGGGELFGVRNDYISFPTIGIELGNANWRGATRTLSFLSNRGIAWANSTSSMTTADCGFYRNAAGVIEVNDGTTAGTFRDLIVRNFRMSAPTGVPTANNSTGTEGSIRWDADYIYICTAANTWKRVAIVTWP